MVKQEIQVSQVVWKPKIVCPARLRLPVAAPVWRDHVMVIFERIHYKLVRRGHIHPTMHHDQWRFTCAGLAPHAHVVVQVADRDKLAARGSLDWVHSGNDKDSTHATQSKQRQV